MGSFKGFLGVYGSYIGLGLGFRGLSNFPNYRGLLEVPASMLGIHYHDIRNCAGFYIPTRDGLVLGAQGLGFKL